MTRVFLLLLLGGSGCQRAPPCEPWTRWKLTALSDAPGERLERCVENELRWRVTPGGLAGRWLDQLERMPIDGGWRLWRRRALVREGSPAVSVEVQRSGDELVVTLRPTADVEVGEALAELAGAH